MRSTPHFFCASEKVCYCLGMSTYDIGSMGEQRAAEELVRLGYKIIERNWKTKWAEIDIVASKQNILYFVEVKYRKNSLQGDGFDYITDKKISKMTRAAELWVVQHNEEGQYELLCVSVGGESGDVDVRTMM